MKVDQAKAAERIEKLERDNNTLRDKVIDIQARPMRNNLLFFNMPESEGENTTEMINHLLESKMEVEDAQNKLIKSNQFIHYIHTYTSISNLGIIISSKVAQKETKRLLRFGLLS
jgi:hypothetical protein